ncbi:hypothetical protein ACLQ2R_03350 [Streptosporangium sp. DT93]|uniref:hypothetical protein n=1 Tax=Streptosporangium sp. DT93 TaxID=3393428 RepID=UPI003CF5B4F0
MREHYRVALLLADGARIRPACRVSGCDWEGQAHVYKPAAEYERTIHQRWHAARTAKTIPSRTATS